METLLQQVRGIHIVGKRIKAVSVERKGDVDEVPLSFIFSPLLQKAALEDKGEAPRGARYKVYAIIMLRKENKEIARDRHPGAAGGDSTGLRAQGDQTGKEQEHGSSQQQESP